MNSFDIHLKNILNNDNNRYFNDLELKNNEIEKLKSYANLNFASKHSYILNLIGVNVNTVPVLDLRRKYSHNIIGDRSYSYNKKIIR